MALRHRALARLNRHVPDVVAVDRRALSSRLVERDAELPAGPSVGGERVALREVHERSLRGPQAGPNAPLLIRLVRHPYALHPVRPARRADTERPQPRGLHPEREPALRIREVLEAERAAIGGSRPERDRAEAPPRPFRRARIDDDVDTVPLGAL